MRILLFTQYFYPEIGAAPNRAVAHSRHWVDGGHHVTVVTSVPNSPYGCFFPNYRNKLYQRELWARGVEIVRVYTFPAGKKDSTWKRILSFVIYSVACISAVIRVETPDIVIASAPYLSGIPALIGARMRKVPLIYEMRDPWIQVNLANKKLDRIRFIYKWLYSLEKFIIRKSACVVVIGNAMADYVKRTYDVRTITHVIYNGASTEIGRNPNKVEAIRRRNEEFKGKFVVGFLGNMNSAYDLEVVVEAAIALESTNCMFIFVGEGTQKAGLLKKIKRLGLKNVKFYSAVPYDESFLWFEVCDLTVIPLKADEIYNVYLPIKIFDSMAVGRSVLFGGSGEGRQIIEKSGGGTVFLPGNSMGLIEAIKVRMKDRSIVKKEGEAGRKFVATYFTRRVMAEKYLNVMTDILNKTQ